MSGWYFLSSLEKPFFLILLFFSLEKRSTYDIGRLRLDSHLPFLRTRLCSNSKLIGYGNTDIAFPALNSCYWDRVYFLSC